MSRIPIEATLKTLATKDPPFADFNIQSEEPKEQENNDVESLSKEAEAQARAETAALEQDKGVTRIEALCKSKSFFTLLFLYIYCSTARLEKHINRGRVYSLFHKLNFLLFCS